MGDSAFAVEQKNRRKLNVTSERVTPPVVTPGKNNPFAYAVNSTLTVPAEAREAYVNAERWGDPKNYKLVFSAVGKRYDSNGHLLHYLSLGRSG